MDVRKLWALALLLILGSAAQVKFGPSATAAPAAARASAAIAPAASAATAARPAAKAVRPTAAPRRPGRRPSHPSKAPPPRPGSVRSILYTEAYQKSPEMGQHLAIKITPPGTHGKRGFILVEAYNYSNVALNAVDLRISMQTAAGEELDANISANHVRPGLSGLTSLKLPDPDRPVKVVQAKIKKMAIFDNLGKRIALNYYIDIIR